MDFYTAGSMYAMGNGGWEKSYALCQKKITKNLAPWLQSHQLTKILRIIAMQHFNALAALEPWYTLKCLQ